MFRDYLIFNVAFLRGVTPCSLVDKSVRPPPTQLHGVTIHRTVNFSLPAVRTSKSQSVRTCCGVKVHSNCYNNRSIDRLSRGSPWFFFQIGNLCGHQDADVTATAHVLYTSVRTTCGRVLLFALQSLIVSACWQDLIALFNHHVWIFPVV
jgi:hypothetical protein